MFVIWIAAVWNITNRLVFLQILSQVASSKLEESLKFELAVQAEDISKLHEKIDKLQEMLKEQKNLIAATGRQIQWESE